MTFVVWVHEHRGGGDMTITLQWPFVGRRAYRGSPRGWSCMIDTRRRRPAPWTKWVLDRVYRKRVLNG